jgi:hypothetical protein
MRFRVLNDVRINGLLAAAILGLIVLGCTCGDETSDNGSADSQSSAVPKAYWGEWSGEDDSSVAIRADGSGDFISSGMKVTGGSVSVDESARTLSITLLGIGKTLSIDVPPQGKTMTLSGVIYTRKGASNSGSAELPSNDELQTLARKTMLDFDDALQRKDFTNFHSTLSKPFQKQYTPEKLAEGFGDFIKVKATFKSVAKLDANFTEVPMIGDVEGFEMLQLTGYYPTTPRRTKFALKYIFEEGVWKLAGININTKD